MTMYSTKFSFHDKLKFAALNKHGQKETLFFKLLVLQFFNIHGSLKKQKQTTNSHKSLV